MDKKPTPPLKPENTTLDGSEVVSEQNVSNNQSNDKETGEQIVNEKKKKKFSLSEKKYKEILLYMQKHYPNLFPLEGNLLALAVGIHKQIFAIEDFPFSKIETRRFLMRYTRKKNYLELLKVGNNRYHLDGTVSSQVLFEETLDSRKKKVTTDLQQKSQ